MYNLYTVCWQFNCPVLCQPSVLRTVSCSENISFIRKLKFVGDIWLLNPYMFNNCDLHQLTVAVDGVVFVAFTLLTWHHSWWHLFCYGLTSLYHCSLHLWPTYLRLSSHLSPLLVIAISDDTTPVFRHQTLTNSSLVWLWSCVMSATSHQFICYIT